MGIGAYIKQQISKKTNTQCAADTTLLVALETITKAQIQNDGVKPTKWICRSHKVNEIKSDPNPPLGRGGS